MAFMWEPVATGARARGEARGSRPRKALTIGAVAKILSQEFDDISISKIRYLEDQKLLAPRRTPGGYRLYSQADVERLQAILRMQRDEFLPLRVIRQELASGAFDTERRPPARSARSARDDRGLAGADDERRRADRAGRRQPGVPARAVGVRGGPVERRDGRTSYDETDLEIVRAAAELARHAASPAGTSVSSGAPPTARQPCSSSSQGVAALAKPGAAPRGGREPREPRPPCAGT